MIKLCIFDLDGTLVNSLGDLAAAVNDGLAARGFPVHPTEAYKNFVGDGVMKLLERALPAYAADEARISDMREHFNAYYSKHYLDSTAAYDGIAAVLSKLHSDGITSAVFTNKPQPFALDICATLFPQTFAYVIGNTTEIPRKPDPYAINLIMDKYAAEPQETVMLGDSNVDIYAAKAAGVHSIGCLWGFRTKRELTDAGAEIIISSPDEIMGAIQILDKGAML